MPGELDNRGPIFVTMDTRIPPLKTIIHIIVLASLWLSCNLFSSNKKQVEDSLQYYPPTPGKLDKQEFREYYRALTGLLDTVLVSKDFSGGILIARDGEVIYERYKGFADPRTKDPMTDSTSMHIASVTKTFTSVAILQMIQNGKLSLEDTLGKFFPGFPYHGITVKMLLSHRSGLPNYLYFMSNADWDKKVYCTNQDVLNYLMFRQPEKSFSPGKRFSYCNTNFLLLAMIIEELSGKSYPEYMKETIFDPLQMHNTYVFTLKDTLTATPTFTGGGTYWNFDFLDGTYGDKNIYTTPRDLLKWDQALYTNQILQQQWLDSAFTGYSFEKPGVHNYGLGWRLQMLPNGKKVIYHFGKWHGSNAAFARLTEEKATIIIIGNRFSRSIYNAAHACYGIFGDYVQKAPDDEETDSVEMDKNAGKKTPGKISTKKKSFR